MCNGKLVQSFKVDLMTVEIYESNVALGRAAAEYAERKVQEAIAERGQANLVLATGASQFTFIDAFKEKSSVDWSKIRVFHLDEYKNMSDQHPASFRKFLRERILDEIEPAEVNYLAGDAKDIEAEIIRYENLLKTHPIDLACIGIGENGHIAFNDPAVADFNDARLVKEVELDEACRRQQLGEGWFPTFEDVPQVALSLTIPAIMNSKAISCVVPDKRKAAAVYDALYGPISTACPASILRKHSDVTLFLDPFSAEKLEER
ncbi:MAG: glucosamine-6-phosphate deaminase [Fidelibacterota bacterium]|nr:MAG: glucosamine-6-phosphate deaminase [Candidatus Neomarinimicrobiota bacterium]